MDDKPVVKDGTSVTEFDAENVKTSKEKRRDDDAGKNIRKAE